MPLMNADETFCCCCRCCFRCCCSCSPSSKEPILLLLLDQKMFCNNRSRLNQAFYRLIDDLCFFKAEDNLFLAGKVVQSDYLNLTKESYIKLESFQIGFKERCSDYSCKMLNEKYQNCVCCISQYWSSLLLGD